MLALQTQSAVRHKKDGSIPRYVLGKRKETRYLIVYIVQFEKGDGSISWQCLAQRKYRRR
jgi:hypothetical protein